MGIMSTEHRLAIGDARIPSGYPERGVDLVVTSPPYPMIEMWDESFQSMNPEIHAALKEDPNTAFEYMHLELDRVWANCARLLKPGGIMLINVGDATRTINGDFRLYSNHARIIQSVTSLGLSNLPNILWRKSTNAPNKFMGSGMLPAGAYVTLEHEYFLVFRKEGKRKFATDEEKQLRRESAFFWEERNVWFSDLWEFTGIRQALNGASRERSGAFPPELPLRAILMYSCYGDLVLDPFAGTGTTALVAGALGRNSHSIEVDPSLAPAYRQTMEGMVDLSADIAQRRLEAHVAFVAGREMEEKPIKHYNEQLRMPVMTAQETSIRFFRTATLEEGPDGMVTHHEEICAESPAMKNAAPTKRKRKPKEGQHQLFTE